MNEYIILCYIIFVCTCRWVGTQSQHYIYTCWYGEHSSFSFKQKCHFDKMSLTGCIENCKFDNFWCSWWWKFHPNEDISFSGLFLMSMRPGVMYHMCQWTGLSFVEVMVCHLFSTKPHPEPTIIFLSIVHPEINFKKVESKYKTMNSRKCIWQHHK